MRRWVKTTRRAKCGVLSSLDHAENENTSGLAAWTLGKEALYMPHA